MLVRYLPPLDRDKCNSWLKEASESTKWTNAFVYQRIGDRRGSSNVDPSQRNASVLARASCIDMYDEFDEYLSTVSSLLADIWDISVQISWEGTQLVRYSSGGFFISHRDSSDLFPERVITVIAYLNDDFGGGETHFPNMETDIIPKQGTVVSFPSDFIHSAKPVLSGEKFIFVTWATVPQVSWI